MNYSLFPELDLPPSIPKEGASKTGQRATTAPLTAHVAQPAGFRRPTGEVALIWQEHNWQPQPGLFVQFNTGIGIDMISGQYRCISRPFGCIQAVNETTGEALVYLPAHPQWKSYDHAFWTVPFRDLLPVLVDEDLFSEEEYRSRMTRTYTGSFRWGRTPI